ncbi:MAG: diphosphate--fructose-6-phosphate 1-phosphotransferase [Nanoarchaeota archaeon]|nr:diphosphate--fructose-6-phosphate 1-phosphotransferase [Nanoarchaeota archaeon]
MTENNNVLVAQSGGPSPVINASVLGVYLGCEDFPDTFGEIFAGWHGIEGVLKEKLINLSKQNKTQIELLRTTPAAGAIGTCRYKLKPEQEEDLERVVDVLKAHNVGYFFYAGGNDSMDTANRVAELAQNRGLDLVAVGVAKTIDNDVGGGLNPDGQTFSLIDHTPGYGSTARYWAWKVAQWNQENMGSSPSDPVLVGQAMGRKIGFIPAAARLGDTNRELPLIIAMAESGVGIEELYQKVHDTVVERGRALVIVSEGYDVGNLGAAKDTFGHSQFSTGTPAAEIVTAYINGKGLPVPGNARFQVMGTDQRNDHTYISSVDLQEAELVGKEAVRIAIKMGSGYMATIIRKPGDVYSVEYGAVPLGDVANSERMLPKDWIDPSRVDVTDGFVRYALPLIGEDPVPIPVKNGRPIFAVMDMSKMEEQTLPTYIPEVHRKA